MSGDVCTTCEGGGIVAVRFDVDDVAESRCDDCGGTGLSLRGWERRLREEEASHGRVEA